MTSQTMTMEELKEEAKASGVKGVHLYKDEDKLLNAIEEAKAEVKAEPERKKAPRMQVRRVLGNARQAKLDELERNDPENKYQYRLAGTDPEKIKRQGFEIVEGETLGDEIVVRTTRESWDEWQQMENENHRRIMDAVDTEGSRILSQNASPKAPVDVKK